MLESQPFNRGHPQRPWPDGRGIPDGRTAESEAGCLQSMMTPVVEGLGGLAVVDDLGGVNNGADCVLKWSI